MNNFKYISKYVMKKKQSSNSKMLRFNSQCQTFHFCQHKEVFGNVCYSKHNYVFDLKTVIFHETYLTKLNEFVYSKK